MLINCTTKGCLKSSEAKLDTDTNIVYCEECGNGIPNVTSYTKKALKEIKQIIRSKGKEPFQTRCTNCNKNVSLYIKEDKTYCKECNTQVQISASFLNGLKMYLENKKD